MADPTSPTATQNGAWEFSVFLTGLTFGLLIGLSNSPVVGAAISGIFGLAGLFMAGAKSNSTKPSTPSHGYETIAPIQPETPIQLSSYSKEITFLQLGVILGLGAGILVRANDLFDLRSHTISEHYEKLGFEKSQIDAIVNHNARVASGTYRNLAIDCKDLGFDQRQTSEIMERHARTILIPIAGSNSLNSDLPKLSTSTKTPKKSGLMSGPVVGWYESLLERINALPANLDSETLVNNSSLEREIDAIRGVLSFALEADKDAQSIELAKEFMQLFEKLGDSKNGDTVKARLDMFIALQKRIKEKLDSANR